MAGDLSSSAAKDRRRRVVALAEELGFGLVGVAKAEPSEHARAVREWIASGRHGEMGYLADHLDTRLDPGRLLPGCRSVIAVADAYPDDAAALDSPRPPSSISHPRSAISPHQPPPPGRIARYAWGDDYHKTIKKRLHRLADALRERFPEADENAFRCTVDTAPALEREHAVRAGLGWQAKNTMLIHPRHGSYFLLGLILTTLEITPELETDAAGPSGGGGDHCGSCTRCIDACPTDAIDPAGYSLDATRCISYLTLEHRSAIDPSLHAAMGEWIAGCDICQDVCPHNTKPSRLPLPIHPRYAPRPPAPSLDLMALLGWSAEDRQSAFTGSALKRIKLDMLKRNALIAAGNALAQRDRPALRRRIAEIAADAEEPELVRTTADQVLERLA